MLTNPEYTGHMVWKSLFGADDGLGSGSVVEVGPMGSAGQGGAS